MILMKRAFLIFKRVFIIVYLLAIHSFAALFIYERFYKPNFSLDAVQTAHVEDPTEKVEVPTPVAIPSIVPDETPFDGLNAQTESNTNQTAENANVQPSAESSGKLMIPVLGIKREQIQDTFNDSRSEGRVHNATDIIAPGGTPVVAASDGEIAKFFDSVKGGITIYQYSSDKRFVYYYAHLQKRADNLKEGDFVKQGTIIGYVGDTGNSGAGNYHLHFGITVLNDTKSIFKGTDINPYPLLKDGIEAR